MYTRFSRGMAAFALLSSLCLPGFVAADQLIMKNGDVITG